MAKLTYLYLLFLFVAAFSFAQEKESPFLLSSPGIGLPFIQNFAPKHYQAGGQNFCILQDDRGLLYFGNSEGLLEYDGISWRLIPLPNRSEVHALAMDESKRVYVGGQKEFGYLQANEKGAIQYVSLVEHIEEPYRNFGDVWSITPTENGTYFRTARALYKWHQNKMKIIALEGSTNWGYVVGKRFFLYLENKGLYELKNDELIPTKGGEKFKNEAIYGMIEIEPDKIFLFAENSGLMLWNIQEEPKPFDAPINQYIRGQTLQTRTITPHLIAIGTRRSGLLIIDHKGKVRYTLDMRKGLQDNFIWAMNTDQIGNLWLALNNGISLVEINSNFTHYNDKTGLYGQVYQVLPYKKYLLAATSVGTFFKPMYPKTIEENYFRPIRNLNTQTWRFVKINDEVLISTNNGLFVLKDTTATLVPSNLKNDMPNPRSWFIMPIPNYPEYLFVNTALGLLLVEKKEGQWQITKKIKGLVRENLFYMLIDNQNNIWIDNYTKGVFRLYFHQPDSATLKKYGKKEGLPDDVKNRVFREKEHWFVATAKGIYSFDYQKEKFVYDSSLTKIYLPFRNTEMSLIRQGKQNEVWLVLNEESKDFKKRLKVLTRKNDSVRFYQFFEKTDKITIRDIAVLDSTTLFSTSEGVYEYHHYLSESKKVKWHTYLRAIIWQDSTLYYGTGTPQEAFLPYSKANISFHWASTYYSDNEAMQYQFFMDGFDKSWSEWQSSSSKSYTNLPEGRYTFKVRAKNFEGQLSNEATYTFQIAAPWYKTIWALIGYFGIGVLLVILAVKIYTIRLKGENERLEKIVEERSAEIRKQKEDIEAKNLIISEQNEELRVTNQQLENRVKERTISLERAFEELLRINRELDNFTYRAAHDIRGPISRLLGLCVVAEMDLKEDQQAITYINLVKNEALNTQNILTKLVRVYEVKSASLRISPIQIENLVEQTIKEISESNSGHRSKFIIEIASEAQQINTDRYLLKHCIANIIENAIFYAHKQENNVWIRTYLPEKEILAIEIRDEGMGIDTEALPHIFEMFYRGTEKSRGAGLGLYITKVAINKLDGNVQVHSEGLNKGTTFILKLPIR
jgi:signal transduction histidine kinase